MSRVLNCSALLLLEVGAALFATAVQVTPPEITADSLIARVLEARQVPGVRGTAVLVREDLTHGTSLIRRLTITSATRERVTTVLYRARATTAAAASALLLTFSPGRAATGYIFNGPDSVQPLTPALLEQPFLGSDLMIGDLTDDFLAWPSQRQMGSEKMLGRDCAIIESRPATRPGSTSARVRSWIALSMALPLKVEKFGADGSLRRQFIVERVARLDDRHWSAAMLTVLVTEGRTRTKLKIVRGDRNADVLPQEFAIETILRSLRRRGAAKARPGRVP